MAPSRPVTHAAMPTSPWPPDSNLPHSDSGLPRGLALPSASLASAAPPGQHWAVPLPPSTAAAGTGQSSKLAPP